MCISAQQYRVSIGTFTQPRTSTYTYRPIYKPKIKSQAHCKRNSSKITVILILCLAITWPFNGPIDLCAPARLQSSYKNYRTFTPSSSYIVDHNFWAKMTHGNRRSNGIKLCHWNAGAGYLSNKKNELENIVGGYKPHVLGISESCFKENQDLQDIQLQDYNIFLSKTLENQNLKVSRVAAYVHKDIIVKVRHDLMNDTLSSVWLELGKPRQKKLLVCIAYREWQYLNQQNRDSLTIQAQVERWTGFLDQWEAAISTGAEICVLGDLNLNFLRWADDSSSTSHDDRLRPLVTQLFDRILPHGFVQLVSVATRIFPGQEPSGLDHFYSNHPEKLSDIQAHYRGASDHKLIFATRYTKSAVSKPRMIRKRSYKEFDPAKFLEAVRDVSFWEIYSCHNVEEAATKLTKKLTTILDKMAPMKNFQVRTQYLPWLSQNTKNKMQERDEAQKIASETKSNDDWLKYKALRNSVNNILKIEKKNWQENKLKHFGNDSSTVWKNLKLWLGWTKGGPPTKLIHNGNIVTKPKDLAKVMNEYFITKVRQLRQKIPDIPGNPLNLVKKLMKNRNCNFQFQPVHPDEVLKIITNLKATKSCGVDNIDAYVIKLAKVELVPVITHIVNLSLENQIFPLQWKMSKIVPLHKKDELMYPKNYRPVSLLPIISKILERAVYQQVVDYFERNNLFHPSHHGFRSKHNTSTALLQMHDVWIEAFDKGDISAVVMLDMSAAFDLVDHGLLLNKMKIYGFNDGALSWMESYLNLRKQKVYIDGCLSEALDVDLGVPQGSILGPLLYIIFTNDLPECVHGHLADNESYFNTHCNGCGGICCFADDSSFTLSSNQPEQLARDISEKYEDIAEYMGQNKLVLNSDKTHVMVMASSHKHKKYKNFGINLDTGTELIEPVDHEKLLGGHISNNFKWNNHIRENEKSMFKNLTCKLNALYKFSKIANFKTRKMVASGLITSTLNYLIQLYGGCSGYLVQILQVLQNRAARCVTKLGWHTETSVLLSQCGWLSIKQMIIFQSLVLLFKIQQEKKPKYLYEKINSRFSFRSSDETKIRDKRSFKTDTAKKGFITRTINDWNNLPRHLREIPNLKQFKFKLKSWVKDNIPIK